MRDKNIPHRRLQGLDARGRRRLAGPIVSALVSRIRVSRTDRLANVLINTSGGFVEIGDYVFFGHDLLL